MIFLLLTLLLDFPTFPTAQL